MQAATKKTQKLVTREHKRIGPGQIILLFLVFLFTVFCFAPVLLVFISAFTDEMFITQHGFTFFPETDEYWRSQGLTLSYKGITKAKGDHELQTVTVEGPGYYTRHYMFEPSGLLAVIIETDEIDTVEYRRYEDGHIDWKIEHEYMEVAPGVLLPKEESFMRLGVLTVLRTEAWLEPRQTLLFNKDK